MMEKDLIKQTPEETALINRATSRRSFLGFSGVALASAALFMAGCKKDDEPMVTPPDSNMIDLGSGDVGILNYAYALEQLEAEFYRQVTSNFFSGSTSLERDILNDIYQHEIAHRDFFKAAIGSAAIGTLNINLSSVNFTSRASVLATAKAFEDLGVSAYNGAGHLISNVDYLLVAGKIVSVEARHASANRDLLNPNSADFAGDDIVDSSGLDASRTPPQVIAIANTYFVTPLSAANLPTS